MAETGGWMSIVLVSWYIWYKLQDTRKADYISSRKPKRKSQSRRPRNR